jgi:4-amino-4-deoxy-L-arabinose transferase-like glycosyltransferase
LSQKIIKFEPNPKYEKICNMATVQPLLFPLLLSWFFLVFSNSTIVANLSAWIFGCLFIIIFYYYIKSFTNIKIAKQISFLFLLTPTFLLTSRYPITDIPLAFFLVFSVSLFLLSIKRNSLGLMAISGIIFSLAMLTKFTVLLIFAPLFFVLIINKGFFQGIKTYLIFLCLSFIIPIVLFFLKYDYILNIIIAKSVQEVVASNSLFVHSMISFGTLYNFGIVIPVLMILSIFSILKSRKKDFIDKTHLIFAGTFILYYFLIIGSTLGRHLIPFWAILFIGFSREFIMLKNKKRFFYFSSIINILLILIWFFLVI